jgi:predicted alpha/beta-fold hydrolase
MRFTFVIAVMAILVSSCGHLFYYPDRIVHDDPVKRKIAFNDVFLPVSDNETIHVRHFPTTDKSGPWGVLMQFHGNAQNLSSHYGSVIWAIRAGLDVVTFDYRGYGQSTGSADGAGIRRDIPYVFEFVSKKNLPIFAIGQSLGGAILLKGIEDLKHEQRKDIAAVILESTFASYQGVAKTKLKSSWISYPLKFLVPLLISDELAIKNWQYLTMPVMILHDLKDPIVPSLSSETIEKKVKMLNPLNQRLTYETEFGSHVASFIVEEGKYRKILIDWLKSTI